MFSHYKSCIYSYKFWNVLTVLWTVILSNIHIIPILLLQVLLYMYLHSLKCIHFIMDCNIVPYSYYLHIIITNYIMFIHTCKHTHWNVLTVLLTVILSHIHIPLMFCHYISCIYSYRLWNVLTTLLTVILSHIHISHMFCHYISCIYSYRFWNSYEYIHHKNPLFLPWTIHNIHG